MRHRLYAVRLFSGAFCRAPDMNAQEWRPKAAAEYLDQRASWWITCPKSGRDHETFSISCHTAAPLALGSLASAAGRSIGFAERTEVARQHSEPRAHLEGGWLVTATHPRVGRAQQRAQIHAQGSTCFCPANMRN
jgi:hypothetical protein